MDDPSNPAAASQGELTSSPQRVPELTPIDANQRQAQEIPSAIEERYRALVETTGTGYCILDAGGRVREANAEYIRLTGRKTLDEIQGHGVVEWTAGHDRERNAAEVAKCLARGFVHNLEIDYVDQAGHVTPVELNAAVLGTGPGTQILTLCRDTTERKRTEEELSRHVAELTALNLLSRKVSNSLSLEAVVASALETILGSVKCDLAFLFLREGERLVLAGIAPQSGRELLGQIPEHRVGECMCGIAVRLGQPVFSRNIFTDVRCTWEECKKAGLHSFAALPMRQGENIVGVLGLASRTERDFTRQADFLETIAGTAATGLQNARLFEETKRAENTLRTSEEHFRRLFDLSPVGAVLAGAGFRFLRCNEAFCRFVGYAESELQQKTVQDVTHPEDRGIGIAEAQTIFAGQLEVSRHQKRYLHKDGHAIWGEVCIRVLRDSDDRPRHYLVIILDISEQKRIEKALLESEETFSKAFHNASVLMAIVDLESGRYLDVNETSLALLGYTREEIIGRTAIEVGMAAAEDIQRRDMLLQKNGQVAGLEVKMRKKNGGVLHIQNSGQIVTIMGQKRLLSVSVDITGRREMEERIQQLGHLRQRLLGAGRLGEKLQLITDCTVTILGVDLAQIWTVQKADLCDRPCPYVARSAGSDICRDRTRCFHLMASSGRYARIDDGNCRVPLSRYNTGRAADSADARFATNETCHEPCLHDHAWAEQLGLVAYADRRLVSGNGKTTGALALFSTKPILPKEEGLLEEIAATASLVILTVQAEQQRHELETQMQQAQKLESLGLLAGGIAHDFNNLLTAILGHANLALMDLAPESPARDSLREIDKASGRAADLCRQMLAYAGKGRFVVEPINVTRLVEEVAHLLQVSISKKVLLRCQLAEGLPAIVADPAQIRQIVMNLVINAAEAIGDTEGVIGISTGIVQSTEERLRDSHLVEPLAPGQYVFLEVTDTGCGMDATTLDKIFDPFFTTKFTGRGLGLAAVLGIVRHHRGTLNVESEPGRGTTFRVLFPASAKTAAAAESGGNPSLWRGKGTILLVDDEEPVRNVTARMLERSGFKVLRAADGREAIELFRAHASEVVCVLLDLAMPRMDGEETFRELFRIQPAVRVVLASGYSDQEIAQRFQNAGLAGFIEKPYRVETLIAKLREVLTQRA
jgi:PAS domain S-box-containing protein